MENELIMKGVSKAVIVEAFLQWEIQGGTQDEVSMIKELLEKKHYSPECGIKEKNRIYGFLLRRGFSVEKVQEVMKVFD